MSNQGRLDAIGPQRPATTYDPTTTKANDWYVLYERISAKGRCVFEAEDLRDWRGADVVDAHASKIGTLEAVYFDTATEQPVFATVRVGMVGRHRLVFVPLAGATVAPEHVRVQADKKLVKDAPSIEVDGELSASDEPAIFEHYKLAYQPGASGERRLGRR
jgi:hypothetical protein